MVLARLRMDELVNAWVGDKRTPFQIALIGVFDARPFARPDGTVDVARVRSELALRARHVTALGRTVVWTRLGEGRPVWAADPCFDPTAHIVAATLPRDVDLATWAAQRAVLPLETGRPLWRIDVVDGLPDGRFAVIVVLHHIVADGLAGVAIAGRLLDQAPDDVPAAAPAVTAPALPSHRDLVHERLHELGAALRRNGSSGAGEPAGHGRGVRGFREVMADFGGPEPVTSLPRRVGPGRRLVIVRQPIEAVRRTGHALGVTVNDLLLAAVAGGLRELLTARGDDVTGLVLRTTVPAATGRPGQVAGMLVVPLPVGEPDPMQRLALVAGATAKAKARLHAAGDVSADVLQLPVPVARPVVRLARRFGSTRVSLSVTDITGPPAPLWLGGARLLEAVPVAPLVPLVPLSVAALSYTGQLAVSVNADATVTDLHVLAGGIAGAFAVLRTRAPGAGRSVAAPGG